MAIVKTVVADDKLTTVEEIDLLSVPDDELDELFPPERQSTSPQTPPGPRDGAGGFEWTVRAIEAFWRSHAPTRKTASGRVVALPEPLTLAAYARDILGCIARLRRALAHNASLEGVVLDAMRLGRKIEDARGRFNHGKSTRIGIERRLRKQASGKQSGKARRANNIDRDRIIAAVAHEIRCNVPYSVEHSTRWLADRVAHRLQTHEGWLEKGWRALSTGAIRGRLLSHTPPIR